MVEGQFEDRAKTLMQNLCNACDIDFKDHESLAVMMIAEGLEGVRDSGFKDGVKSFLYKSTKTKEVSYYSKSLGYFMKTAISNMYVAAELYDDFEDGFAIELKCSKEDDGSEVSFGYIREDEEKAKKDLELFNKRNSA